MKTQIAGHLLVECLVAQGVTHAFGVPGESYLAVLDGFHAYREQIRFVTNRQEGGAAFMAEAHGKLTGRPGVCFVTRGPGATNASIGVHTAFQDSTPMVLFVGDVASDMRDREAFQEVNYEVFFGPSTKGFAKRVERIDDARRIPEYVARAFATAMNGRPGPVVLVLPEDMLTQEVGRGAAAAHRARCRPGATPAPCAACASCCLQAQRPLVMAGGGGWTPQAAQALQRFAENWKLPVGNAFRFQDTFDNQHPQYAGDVGIALESEAGAAHQGQRPDPRHRPAPGRDDHRRLHAAGSAAHPAEAGAHPRQRRGAEPRLPGRSGDQRHHERRRALAGGADARRPACPGRPGPRPATPTTWPICSRRPCPAASTCRPSSPRCRSTCPTTPCITNGAGNFASWVHRFWRYHGLAKGDKTQLAPTNGAMGYGVPAGIAAAITTGRTVFTIAGDGDFLMNGQELATAVQHGAKTIIVLLNNGMYGTIRMHQEREYPQHVSGSQLSNPDFAALARAYGYAGVRITRTAEFEAELKAALARSQGTLIEVMLDPEVITTRGTLGAITQAALARQG